MASKASPPATQCGIRIKNPLSKPVRVEVVTKPPRLIKIVAQAVVLPHTTVYLPVDAGDYDLRTTIVDSSLGHQDELGDASWKQIHHVDVAASQGAKAKVSKKRSKNPQPDAGVEIRSLGQMFEEIKKEEVQDATDSDRD